MSPLELMGMYVHHYKASQKPKFHRKYLDPTCVTSVGLCATKKRISVH
jgi:hypothetical protein